MESITGVHIINKNSPPLITVQPPDDLNLAKSMPNICNNYNEDCFDKEICSENNFIKKRSLSECRNQSSQKEVPINHRHNNKSTRYKKKDVSPTDVLKNKLKSSLSLHNLNSSNISSYDKYHTVHGNCDTSSNNSPNVFNSHSSIYNGTSVNQKQTIVKCCCGKVNCATVVPLQQYLETYFIKMVRLFKKKIIRFAGRV